MNNEERRRIINQAKADGYTGSYVDLFRQATQDPQTFLAQTPQEKQAGLRPMHEAGRTDASMAFPDVPPNTPFNTVGMKAPIDIKKYDEQGHLVKSYENVPPGLTNIDSGPAKGTVLETPSRMQKGGFASDNTRVSMPAPPEMYLNEPPPRPTQTFLGPQPDISKREKEGLDRMFKADQRRREQIAKGVNPNTAFMTPPGLGADNEARAAYEYDNPATSNIGQIAGGIGFLPIDKGLDIAMTAAGAALRKNFKPLFKSEIDWGAWNPDTPNHPSLMEEYRNIEFQTKKNGTWMKNADGSPFRGRPEQFIQENSSHFKKAFPDGAYRTSRGIKFEPHIINPETGKPYPDMDIDPGFGYKPVFSADPGLASTPQYSGWGYPERFTPFSKRKWGEPQGLVADLYGKESTNSYRIVSQGDDWRDLRVSGAPKDEIERRLTSQKIGLDIEKGKPAQYRNESTINKLETQISRYEWFAKNYDKVVNKTPSKFPDFEQAAKNKFGSTVQTDFLGNLGYEKGLDDIRMFGLSDGDWGAHVNIHMNKPGNFLKSRTGNVGFFDMKSDDIFKAVAPIGVGVGMMSQQKHGGYRKAQKGQAVDYLLGALGEQSDQVSAAEIGQRQAQDAQSATGQAQRDLAAEEQRVKDVRANVIPTAQNLAQLNYDILNANTIFSNSAEYRPHLEHFNKMKRAKTPEEYRALEAEAKKSYPELLEAIPENNIMEMRPSKYDADDELYCTPYGCYTYKKAGATDVPEYSGNYGFVGGVRSGQNPFKRISAAEAEPGDVALMTEYSPVDYRDPSKGKALRPHHTTILSQKTDDPDEIYAYQADDGTRLKFREDNLRVRDVKDDEGKLQEGRFDYYRYIGQTPQAQRAVGDAKHNQQQADLAARALQQNADMVAQMPEDQRDYVRPIDRRASAQVESDSPEQDIVRNTTKQKKRRKTARQRVENVSNRVQGELETVKQRKARVKAARKAANEKIRAIRSGQ